MYSLHSHAAEFPALRWKQQLHSCLGYAVCARYVHYRKLKRAEAEKLLGQTSDRTHSRHSWSVTITGTCCVKLADYQEQLKCYSLLAPFGSFLRRAHIFGGSVLCFSMLCEYGFDGFLASPAFFW